MRAYKLKEGFIFNPLLKQPRNGPCPCQSGKKFKKCCLNYSPRGLELAALERFIADAAKQNPQVKESKE